MTTLIHLASGLEGLIAWVAAAWMGFSELITAALLLTLLDKLAHAIRFTYRAGQFVGKLWFTYGLPALLATADFISWVNSHIDWIEVLVAIKSTLVTISALLFTAGEFLHKAHKRWVGEISWEPPAVTSPVNASRSGTVAFAG